MHQGLTVFCHGFVQASCKYIKVYFTCSPCKRKLLGFVSVGFDEMDQLLIICFGFVRDLKKKNKGNVMGQCMEFKEAHDLVRWRSCIIFSMSLVSP